MALPDRIVPLCDLLMGAAHADAEYKDREDDEVRALLGELCGGDLPVEVETRLNSFDPKQFDLARTAATFRGDPEEDRKRLLVLVAAINDADDEVDFAEDDYLRALAKALDLPDSALEGLVIDMEVDELREDFEKVRKGPPPMPKGKSSASIDVDID
jgi:uncharacterized tellurite resistance protein B-like protein